MTPGKDIIKSFGANLRARRKRAGRRQAELAAAAGISRTTLTNIETGRFSTTLETVARLADALGVPAAELMTSLPAPAPGPADPPDRWLW
jgi:transcriptional regulator with XRE-family HTH domain